MNKQLRIDVIKSPIYKIEDALDTYMVKDGGSTKIIPCNEENKKVMQNQLDCREWNTYDGSVSLPVRMFMSNCKKYTSYYGGSYNVLFAAEGGLHLSYLYGMPWYKLRNECLFYPSIYCDMKGRNSYGTSRDVPVEEIVIFEETLKREGAHIIVTLN